MKTTNILLAIIGVLLFWIALSLNEINLIRSAQAEKDEIVKINVVEVAGRPLGYYGDVLPIRIVYRGKPDIRLDDWTKDKRSR